MERDFALEHLQEFLPQVVARNTTELVDILGDARYPRLCEAASEQLIRIGPLARPHVPRLLELAEECEHAWHKFRVEYVLTAIGDFRPEVVRVINGIRSLNEYQMFHPNTDLHPNTGSHYIDAVHLSDRLRSSDSDGEQSHATEPAVGSVLKSKRISPAR